MVSPERKKRGRFSAKPGESGSKKPKGRTSKQRRRRKARRR